MEFRHLRYFIVLAEELHFGRAAKRLNISQPPLSFNIKQLETSLGVTLFIRNSHGVRLTPAGDAFRRSAQRVLTEANAAALQVREVAAGVTSRVRIGFVGSMLFRGLFPTVQIELTELNSAEQLEALARGSIDLGFVHTERIPGDLQHALYMSEPFVCCMPAGHLAARGKTLNPERLKASPLVLFSRGASPDYYERVVSLCALIGWQPLVRHEVRHWLSVVALVRKGMGVALVPRALMDSGVADLIFKPLPDSLVRSDVHVVWRERHVPDGLLQRLLPQPLEGSMTRLANVMNSPKLGKK
jgi:DNA-binding transcriptional LysR family regulator